MKALALAALVPFIACAQPAPLSGSAGGKSTTETKKPVKPAKVVSLSGNATATGSAR